jgi:chromosome segregation protein
MRLKSLKISGFKSFVDTTTLQINNQLVGIVGPNGCGKSNVIDAVRWVMGGTAKNIRGGISTDVIFNGSSARKPVGQASVELVFDNTDGKLGGEYAQYSEIAIKRSINRDGMSTYYLNGARCRLKDINDIFMGTGLGPKSYAIIEQGMISRVVESKPEELRVFVEEAAGISKYKERRRETENRIRHTRDNLDRLNDLREELEKQLQRLHRQAQSAERFKRYKSEQRQLKTTLTVLILTEIETDLSTLNSDLLSHNNELEAALTDLQRLRTECEKLRIEQHSATDKTNNVQKIYYDLGTEIAKNEQQLTHLHEQKKRFEDNIIEFNQKIEFKKQQMQENAEKTQQLIEEQATNQPLYEETLQQIEEIQLTLQNSEGALQAAHQELQNIQQEILSPTKIAEGEKMTITQLEKQIHEKGKRKEKLEEDLSSIQMDTQIDLETLRENELMLEESKDTAKQALEECTESQDTIIDELKSAQFELNTTERELIDSKAQLNALIKVQENALGKENKDQQQWLDDNNLLQNSRLVEKLNVDPKWSLAVEVALEQLMQAVVLEPNELEKLNFTDQLGVPANFAVLSDNNNIEKTGLLAYVQNHNQLPEGVAKALSLIHCADSITDALQKISQYSSECSLITTTGAWIGKGWIKGKKVVENQQNMLEREDAINHLKPKCKELTQKVEELKELCEQKQEQLEDSKNLLKQLQADAQKYNNELLNLQGELKVKQNQLNNELDKKQRLESEIQECTQFLEDAQSEVNQSRVNLSQALDKMEQFAQQQSEVQEKLRALENENLPLKQKSESLRKQSHELSLSLNTQANQISNLESQSVQAQVDLEEYVEKLEELQMQFEDIGEPIYKTETIMQTQLEERVVAEKALNEARDQSTAIENTFNQKSKTIQETEEHINYSKDTITQVKMRLERLSVQKENEEKQLSEQNITFEQAKEQALPDIDKQQGLQEVENLDRKIQKLGAINLAAIEEFESAQERKVYLDTQNDDLVEALTTLEDAISKIDKETRQKFKETFDKIDEGFKFLFPRLFGGGEAKLILTGDDLLDTGVNIVARPPGKRNTTIQQLSGGEKALTAVSLVFSIFLLNPAPFCMLDEVDAPLDDNNVGRFCELVKEMSDKVQFMYISHNKLAIEMAQALHGVTMREAGVSRLVSVDVDKATKIAEMEVKEES